ncbi:MAG TPA: nucleotidyltransferase domain-containing protein [Candidatus Deferrimicrobium sp.]|nr:nucleotidyltransferase domain-containing protein [Candidatus Deferrimicrobium sp.]
MNSNNIERIKEILSPLKDQYEVVLFGSFIENATRPTSDIDISVLSRTQDEAKNIQLQKDLLGQFPLKFDIRVFELFPIYIQISIVQNYIVIFGDPLDISEYFYHIRKKWDDCKYRILSNQFSSYHERLSLIKE